jgi:hypothetical protein
VEVPVVFVVDRVLDIEVPQRARRLCASEAGVLVRELTGKRGEGARGGGLVAPPDNPSQFVAPPPPLPLPLTCTPTQVEVSPLLMYPSWSISPCATLMRFASCLLFPS